MPVLRTELSPDAGAASTADGRDLLEDVRAVRREVSHSLTQSLSHSLHSLTQSLTQLSCVLRDVCALVGHAPMLGLVAGMAARGLDDVSLGGGGGRQAPVRWPRLECALYCANVVAGSVPTPTPAAGGMGGSNAPDAAVCASLHTLVSG
jgi:hypothetical protein